MAVTVGDVRLGKTAATRLPGMMELRGRRSRGRRQRETMREHFIRAGKRGKRPRTRKKRLRFQVKRWCLIKLQRHLHWRLGRSIAIFLQYIILWKAELDGTIKLVECEMCNISNSYSKKPYNQVMRTRPVPKPHSRTGLAASVEAPEKTGWQSSFNERDVSCKSQNTKYYVYIA